MLTKPLKKACKRAQRRLVKHGIYGMEKIHVYMDVLDLESGCFAEPIKIGIGLGHIAGSLKDPDGTMALMVHEYAHAMSYQLWSKMTKAEIAAWQKVFGPFVDKEDPYAGPWASVKEHIADALGLADDDDDAGYDEDAYVSAYATVSAQEDWAETVSYIVLGEDIPDTKVLNRKVAMVHKMIAIHQKRC